MKLIRKHMSGQKGFTLIELLVVVAILGILATIAVPRVMDAIDNARTRKAEADLTVVRDALERWYLDYGIFPPGLYWLSHEAYVDPNFTYKNSYGKFYFYAVKWNGANNTESLTDYVLGDPGKIPAADGGIFPKQTPVDANYPNGRVCEGANKTTEECAYYWWDEDLTSPPPVAELDLDSITPDKTWTGVVSGKIFTLEGNGDTDADLVEFTYVDGDDVALPAQPTVHKPQSPPIVYQGQQ